nr:putative ribonuclease H-like domain-containing protein [Tanacetum cinerariifolium]
GNLQQALKNKCVIDSGFSRHMTGNISFLSDFKEFNGGYVAFGGNPKGGKISGKGKVRKETVSAQQYVLLPLWSTGLQDPHNTNDHDTFDVKEQENEVHVSPSGSNKTKKHDYKAKRAAKGKSHAGSPIKVRDLRAKFKEFSVNSTNSFNTVSSSDTDVSPNFRIAGKSSFLDPSNYHDDPDMSELEDIVYSDDDEDVGAKADLFNLETNISVSLIPTTRVYKDHPVTQIISNLTSAPQTRSMERVEEGIDYDELFARVARIEAIRLFLAYAFFMGFMVYQMDVKSAFLYGTIEEEVCVCQPLGFEDPDYPNKVYKVVKALYGLHQAPRAWYETLANYLLENGFQRGKIDHTLFIKKQKGDILLVQVYVDDIIFGSTNKKLCKAFEKLMKDKFQMSFIGELTFFLGLQVKKKDDGIFISQDKYVAKILRKFGFTDVKSASTPIKTEKPFLKDLDGEDVDVHIYRYLKGKPHLGLWYPRDSPFNLVAYSDSDYAKSSLDRMSTTRGCQFLCCILISWQCKKQTVVATSSTKAEYVAAASCCAQVLWIQNQLLAYGEELDSPKQTALGQTATGKENSNPFMADSILLTMLAVKLLLFMGYA